MSVEVLLSSRKLELDQNNQSILTLKASFNLQSTKCAALFKVRTNTKAMVDVRPSFGCLTQAQPIIALNIKWLGTPEDLAKIKLQVNWLEAPQLPQQKMTHSLFVETYKNFKQQINERVQMVELTFKDQTHNSSLIQQDSSRQSELSQTNQQPVQAQQEEPEQPPQEQPEVKVGSSKIRFIVAIVLSFLLGLGFGMRLQQLMVWLVQPSQGGTTLRPSSSTDEGLSEVEL